VIEMEGYATAQEAARGDIPSRFARVEDVSYSADGKKATVVLLTNEPPVDYPYTVYCVYENGRWYPSGGHN
jgi:hypothetical protein